MNVNKALLPRYVCPCVAMLLVCGGLVNGPYALITTAVSADLVGVMGNRFFVLFCFVSFQSVALKLSSILQHKQQVFSIIPLVCSG